MKKALGIALPIVLVIVGGIWAYQSTSNLVRGNPQLDAKIKDATIQLNSATNTLVDECLKTLPTGSPSCNNMRESVKSACETADGKLDACNDGRVERYYAEVANASNSQTRAIDKVSAVESQQKQSEASASTALKPSDSGRRCTPNLICFVHGDFIEYDTYQDGSLFWEKTYKYGGTFDNNRIAVEVHDVNHSGGAMIVGDKTTNSTDSLLETDERVGIYAEEYVGGSYPHIYYTLMPNPMKVETWTKDSPSADYWKDRVKEDTYNYKGNVRSVIVVQDGNLRKVFDKETGIMLELTNNALSDSISVTKLTDTNIIPAAVGYVDKEIPPPKLDLLITVSQNPIKTGSEQLIDFIVTDSDAKKPIENAKISGVMLNKDGTRMFEFSLFTDATGKANTSLKMREDLGKGTFTINAKAGAKGYSNFGEPTFPASMTFEVTP